MSFTNEEGEQEKDDLTYNRQDFWATTSNKQLNFVQHIRTMLKTAGRALPLSFLIMYCLRAVPARQFARNCWTIQTCTPSCDLPTGVFYKRKESRPM